MKRLSIITVIVLMATLAFVSTAFALASGPPTQDAFIDSATATDSTQIQMWSSYSAGGVCSPMTWGYMQFDLSDLGDGAGGTIGYADLQVRLVSTTAAGTATTVTLYGVENDEWTEANVGTVRPLFGDPLTSLTVSAATTVPSTQTFPSSTAFVDFLNAQSAFVSGGADDNTATFGFAISSCTTSATVRFGSSENAGNEPMLNLRTAAPPTAVDVSSTSAERTSFPLYAGLGAVALILVAGLAISRRRTA